MLHCQQMTTIKIITMRFLENKNPLQTAIAYIVAGQVPLQWLINGGGMGEQAHGLLNKTLQLHIAEYLRLQSR